MTLAVNDLLIVFCMALVGKRHSSHLFSNFKLQKEERSRIMGPCIQEEGASVPGGLPRSLDAVRKLRGRWGWRARRWFRVGVCAVAAAPQLRGAVEAGKSSWSLTSAPGWLWRRSWKLNGFSSAGESSSLGTRAMRTTAQRGGPDGGGDAGQQPCCCHGCSSATKWLKVAVRLLYIKKTINK